MKYNLKTQNYCTFNIFEINKQRGRSYFIPFGDADGARSATVKTARYVSDQVTCLSGDWDFCFFRHPADLGEVFDTSTASFDQINVPSCWQFTGYLAPAYINCSYPFSFNPPYVPQEEPLGNYKVSFNRARRIKTNDEYNSIGVYRKIFTIDDADQTYTVSFLGVAPCFDLFVNGRFVGYSEGSHNTAEFILDEYLNIGDNEMVVVVHRWCTGTYLEAQDMLRNCGIFRDVLLYHCPRTHIHDVSITTRYGNDGKYALHIIVNVANSANDSVKILFNDMEYVATTDNDIAIFDISDIEAAEWSAETPVLYPLLISLNNSQFVFEKVGFRHIEIKQDVFYFNDRKIKIKGVNHHDTHPQKGFALSPDDMEQDIVLMKEYNVNCVRTSHYPPDPIFIKLSEEYGLYIVDEADIETHGACVSGDVSYISKRAEWKDHYLDRVSRMFFRDHNSCSIIMWSLGNESGGILCQEYCYKYLKNLTDIPVHYEGACREKIIGFDVVSEMYTSIKHMKKRAASRYHDIRRMKPYYLCEYCHAMGVGPGALEDYMELFYSEDIYMGGCIWEWADHAVYHPDTGNYTYGGDHGEYVHDDTFCVDGIVRPDRKPYTSTYLMKAAYRPVRATHLGNGKIRFVNTNRFLSTDYLRIVAQMVLKGELQPQKELDLIIAPTESATIDFEYPTDCDAFLNIDYYDKRDGHLVSTEQVILNEVIIPKTPKDATFKVSYAKNIVTIESSDDVQIIFDTAQGGIKSYKISGKEIINPAPLNRLGISGIYPEIFRAPTDNDRNVKKSWRILGYDSYKLGHIRAKVSVTDTSVTIRLKYRLKNKLLTIARITDEYLITPDGMIRLNSTFDPTNTPLIPRIGKVLELGKEYDHVRYYGRGDMENYPDMKTHTRIGVFERVGNFGTQMIVPQNSGERCDVRWAGITDKNGYGLCIAAVNAPFAFNVNHYSERDITNWHHIIDYRDFDTTYVNVDGFVGGIGSNSCGPLPESEYLIPFTKTQSYCFTISPIKPNMQ